MKRIGLYLFIIGITCIKAYGQEDSGPVNTGAANYLTIPVDARSAAMGGAHAQRWGYVYLFPVDA